MSLRFNLSLSSSALLGLALAASSTTAFATPITPGTSVTPSVITVGTITAANTVAKAGGATLFSGTFNGSYTETVFKDSLNPNGAGDLTFVMTFSNAGPDSIEHITNGSTLPNPLTGFLGFSPIVGYALTGGVAPGTVDETALGVISFDFQAGVSGTIPAGSSTDTLYIQTSATNFLPGLFTLIDSSSSTNPGFVPAVAAATPEPSSLILLGTGLIGAASMARRRFRTNS